MFTWSHLISCTVSWEWSKSLWNCDLQCCSNLTNFKEWWKIVSGTQKLPSTIIGIFNYVLLFHKFYVSNNFDPLLIKKCLKEVLQNPGNPGHLPLGGSVVERFFIRQKLPLSLHDVLRNVVLHHIPIFTEFLYISEGDCCNLTYSMDSPQEYQKSSQ